MRVEPQVAAEADKLRNAVAKELNVRPADVNDVRITRRSIDARQRRVMVNLGIKAATGADRAVPISVTQREYKDVAGADRTLLIVGAGPAGLFAALRALEHGVRPIVIERGQDVDRRRLTLAAISRQGIVDPDTNYCFGEGGAGAYSDGKLFTRSKKRGNAADVLEVLYTHGAKEDILIDAHPHIGSDRLPGIIKNIRKTIEKHGGEVRFDTRMDSLIINDGRVCGARMADGTEIMADGVVLATGHSARDVYRMLNDSGVTIEAKGLAIGSRLEHPQHTIDCIQYHSREGRGKYLPAAEYSFVTQADGRGVYSFCMCPGGVVVPSASGPEQNAVNGMSASGRSSRWANSAMVVELHPGDFKKYPATDPLCMMHLQEDLERNFYEASYRTLKAPAQRMLDFTQGKVSNSLPDTSYAPGVHAAPLHFLLPPQISKRLQQGLKAFGAKSRGFLTNDAMLIGLESRTSSPVRIPRNPETLQHTGIRGLYPAGEGAGYAGGIVSAAIDGIRCADAFSLNV